MQTRCSLLLVLVAVLNACSLLAEDSQWLDGYCGAEAVIFTLNRFGISGRSDEVRQLYSLESASIANIRRAFESEKLKVRSFACESALDSAWEKLNRVVSSQNAVVLVLASQTMSVDAPKHYFIFLGFSKRQLRLLDPRSGINTILDCEAVDLRSSPIHIVIIDHPESSFFTRPPSNYAVSFLVPFVAICLLACKFFARSRLNVAAPGVVTAIMMLGGVGILGCNKPSEVMLVGRSQDLGVHRMGDRIEAEYTVRNLSNTTVRLETLELGCICLRTDFRPQQLPGLSEYKFHIRVEDKLALGVGEQVAKLNVRADTEIGLPIRFRYFVLAEERLHPNPCYLGFPTSEELINGLLFDLSLKNSKDEDLQATVIGLSVASHSGLKSAECKIVGSKEGTFNFVLQAFEARGDFQVDLEVKIECDGAVQSFPVRLLGTALEG